MKYVLIVLYVTGATVPVDDGLSLHACTKAAETIQHASDHVRDLRLGSIACTNGADRFILKDDGWTATLGWPL